MIMGNKPEFPKIPFFWFHKLKARIRRIMPNCSATHYDENGQCYKIKWHFGYHEMFICKPYLRYTMKW